MHEELLRKFCSVCGIFKRSVQTQPLIQPVMSQHMVKRLFRMGQTTSAIIEVSRFRKLAGALRRIGAFPCGTFGCGWLARDGFAADGLSQ